MKSKINIWIAVLVLALVSCLENEMVIDTTDLDFRDYELSKVPIANIKVPLYKSVLKYKEMEELSIKDMEIDGEMKRVICFTYTKTEKMNWDENDIDIKEFSSTSKWGFKIPPKSDWPYSPLDDYQNTMSAKEPITTSTGGESSYVTKAEMAKCILNLTVSIPSGLICNNLVITIPQLKNMSTGQSFTTKTYFNISGDNYKIQENLVKHEFNLTELNGLSNPDEKLLLICTFTVSNTSSGFSGGDISVGLSFTDVKVDYMKGYFGKINYNPEEADKEIPFDFFKDFDFEGTVGIRDIIFDTKVTNSLGVPLKIDATEISFITKAGLQPLKVITASGTKPLSEVFDLDIPAATESGNNHLITPGIFSKSYTLAPIEFNDEQGFPTGIRFDFSGQLNPNGDTPPGENFIYRSDSDLAEAEISVTAPLHAKVGSFISIDKVDFDFNEWIKDYDEEFSKSIEYIELIMLINNQLPFEVELTADAIDKAEVTLENIVKNLKVEAKQENQSIKIKLTQDQIEKLKVGDVKQLLLYTQAKTANEDYVIVCEDDYINVQVFVSAKSSIPSNIFE